MSVQLGVTHTYPGAPVVAQVPVHAQSMMGWGTLSPEPSFGRFEWRTLDERVNAMRHSPGRRTMAITLCGAPDWMKGGTPGETDWTMLERFPDPDHYEAFADLAGRIAQRYDDVSHFMVWNEFKGLWRASLDKPGGQWDADRYGQLYRAVTSTIKRVRPDAKVGGPYAPLSTPTAPGVLDPNGMDALRRWWQALDGAPCDFLVVDGWGDPDFFVGTTRLLHQRYPCMPIWWAELHVQGSPAARRGTLDGLASLTDGADVTALLWEPEGWAEMGLVP